MTDLAKLYQGLRRVRRFRRMVRIGSAAALFAAPLLWALLAAMALDVTRNMGVLERVVTLLIVASIGVWAFRRFIRPAICFKESELESAMLVEERHQIASDLVAAMQFTDPGRLQYGSPALRRAAVERAAGMAGEIDYLEGFSGRQLAGRLCIFALSALIFATPMVLYPGHGRAFLMRWLFLAGTHYPTRTLIRKIESPGDRAPFGQALTFKVRAAGALPEKGMVMVRSRGSGLRAEIELLPTESEPDAYVGQVPRLLDDVSYEVFLGDAYTDPREVRLIPLPVVVVDFAIETPAYAAAKFKAAADRFPGRLALQGSTVVPVVTADKPLQSATITINGQVYPMQREQERFVLRDSDGALAEVEATIHWEVQVMDRDGLSLERPVSGVLQVRPDHEPNITIVTATRMVWSGAVPAIEYSAADDCALDRVTVRLSVQRPSVEKDGELLPVAPEQTIPVASATNHQAELKGTFHLDIAALEPSSGDRILVTFEAFDYRGELPGESMSAPTLVLEVLDREAVIDALHKVDERIDKNLDQIIDAQLGM